MALALAALAAVEPACGSRYQQVSGARLPPPTPSPGLRPPALPFPLAASGLSGPPAANSTPGLGRPRWAWTGGSGPGLGFAAAAGPAPHSEMLLLRVSEPSLSKPIPLASVLRQSQNMKRETSPQFAVDLEEAMFGCGDAPKGRATNSAAYFDYKDESGFPKPPSYNVATTLPSYDEAERTKAEATIPLVPGRDEDFVGRDDFDDADQLRIGNDGIFMLTFFMAFLFNWIGFFLSFCLTTSAAGRYGAISGFGLSLIKWILIVRFSTYFPGYFDGQYWLWWVFLVLGFLLFLRGFINYAKVRKMPETLSNLPRTRVLFIY
ncbi:NEDD4 family-interacting protein 1 [Cebus imitator]|uniref:NEDD4 family-interacting protein 1 n=1 Tax=Cebus imitator TaxID=2715852 RepID=UPI00080A7478|nr:NEDD4 family-interacting protein 1 [Cebus imitator]